MLSKTQQKQHFSPKLILSKGCEAFVRKRTQTRKEISEENETLVFGHKRRNPFTVKANKRKTFGMLLKLSIDGMLLKLNVEAENILEKHIT